MIEPLPIREGRRKRRRHAEGTEEQEQQQFLQGDQAEEDEEEGMEEVLATLSSMKTEVELMRRPLGTYESPARTCKELMMVQPDFTDGWSQIAAPSANTCRHYFLSELNVVSRVQGDV